MLIECPRCEAKVYAVVLAEHEYRPDDYSGGPDLHKYFFLECPSCHKPLLGYSGYYGSTPEEGWTSPERLWPKPQERLDFIIPSLTRKSLEDAQKCFQAKVYTACAVMCGRALEAVCKEKTGEQTLAKGLQKLRATNHIDDRLFEWGEALRKERNIGAHSTDEDVSRLDAEDLLDFAHTIVEYIYVMSAKFEAYKAHKENPTAQRKRARRFVVRASHHRDTT